MSAISFPARHRVEQIDVLVDHHLLPRGTVHTLHFARILLVAARELEELLSYRRVLVHTERQRMVRPRAVHVHHDPGGGVAVDVVELESRARAAELRERAAYRAGVDKEIRRGIAHHGHQTDVHDLRPEVAHDMHADQLQIVLTKGKDSVTNSLI